MKIGLITYDNAHLKTEQLVHRYVRDKRISEITLFALPFFERKKRETLIQHRPDMSSSIPTKNLAKLGKVNFQTWDGTSVIDDDYAFFVIGGAGILDISFACNKPIINAHSGIIPSTRGLDSFKWAIFNDEPLGVTLHIIDNEIDKGEIIAIQHTPVFSSDTLETLARRHYDLEIDMLARVLDFMEYRLTINKRESLPTMRMSNSKEVEIRKKFETWKNSVLSDSANIKNVSIRNVKMAEGVEIIEPSNLYECELGENCFIGPFVEIQKGVIVGDRSRVQSHAFICELVTIGSDCFISHGVMFINDKLKHGGPAGDKNKWISTHVGNNVSIGTNSTVLPVNICDGVIIGAGSVVTKDIKVPGVYAGNPAKKVG